MQTPPPRGTHVAVLGSQHSVAPQGRHVHPLKVQRLVAGLQSHLPSPLQSIQPTAPMQLPPEPPSRVSAHSQPTAVGIQSL